MNEEDFKNKMQERFGRHRRGRERRRLFAGLFIVIIGLLLLAKTSGVLFPAWFFTWPVLFIALGIFSGIRHKFRKPGWLVPVVIGGIFLADSLSPNLHLRPYFWPIILIGAGLFVMLRPKGHSCRRGGGRDDNFYTNETNTSTDTQVQKTEANNNYNSGTDALEVTAIFGGVKKNVLSKNFCGGDITTFMGGTEINLMQADFNGRVTIDTFNMFGGTKLIIPADWEVQSDVVCVIGGIDDKRPPSPTTAAGKVLHLDGTCVFGGLEINSF